MKRSCLVPHATAIGCAFAAAILAGILFASVPARAGIDVRINIGNAPPAPSIMFRMRPHERFYQRERVYIVDDPGIGDYDCFRYGGYYWVFSDGYWYRSPSWRGRFVVVHPRYVPTVFYRLPPSRWKHRPSGPPMFGRNDRPAPPVPARSPRYAPPAPVRNPRLGPPTPVRSNDNRPPGIVKKDRGGPPGPAKKDDKGQDKGDRGRK